jgi:hypothetical protein
MGLWERMISPFAGGYTVMSLGVGREDWRGEGRVEFNMSCFSFRL